MSKTAKDAIASELALLTQSVSFPVDPFGYGSDISCDSDIDPNVAEVDPFSTLAIAQAIVRRLDTPRGSLPDDKDYGIDLRAYANRGVDTNAIESLAGQIRSELENDDRLGSVSVTVRPDSTGKSIGVELAVRPADPQTGGFGLTLSASSASILLEEIRSEI